MSYRKLIRQSLSNYQFKPIYHRYFSAREMATQSSNPFLVDRLWDTPYNMPPFRDITAAHFREAFPVALENHLVEVAALVSNPEPPTFDNTIAAFDRSGAQISLIKDVFQNLCSSCSSVELQAVELELSGPLAAHDSKIYMSGLFNRITPLYETRHDLNLSPEQTRLVERFHLDFVRAGTRFDLESQARYSGIMERLAILNTKFTQNITGDENEYAIFLAPDELGGLPEFVKTACRSAAIERGQPEGYAVTLSRSLVVPFLTFSDNRALREKAWRAWTSRGELHPDRDNRPIAMEILSLRYQQAQMHGYNSFADFNTSDTMAGSPEKVMELLEMVWEPAKLSAQREKDALLQFIEASPGLDKLTSVEPWDWRYLAEKVRIERYSINETEIKPYFTIDRMCQAIFDCANKLFGLRFVYRDDLPVYHPDVKAYEVFRTADDGGDQPDVFVGIFLSDNFSRKFKQSGAWMSSYRNQSRNVDASGTYCHPIVVNNNNFAKAPEGQQTLLSFDDARTLFHEFGHGLHGLLSNVTYQRLSGTSVLRDFVELPSQLYEHWLSQPEVLRKHALHFETNEPISDELLGRMKAAQKFNQGFDTVEFTASALLDMYLHKLPYGPIDGVIFDGNELIRHEQTQMARIGMPEGITFRHRAAHFQHLFSGSWYAAGYYSYLWAEVLDADAFDAFLETGNAFDKTVAGKAFQFIYSSGNSVEPGQAYRNFRGRDPSVQPMLIKRGLAN